MFSLKTAQCKVPDILTQRQPYKDCKYFQVWSSSTLLSKTAFSHKLLISLKNKNQLDGTYYFIVLLIGLTCFGCS